MTVPNPHQLALQLEGEHLYAFGYQTPNTVYTGPFLTQEWRGASWFARLDEEQVDAGIELTLDICRRHGIMPLFDYPSTTYDDPRGAPAAPPPPSGSPTSSPPHPHLQTMTPAYIANQ